MIGDQADSFTTADYFKGRSEPEAYMQMIKDKKFDTRLNLYPGAWHHEGLRTEFDNPLAADIFDRMKSDWKRTIGQLIENNNNIIKPKYIRDDTGETLDCSGLYAFKLNKVLFIALDFFITEAWDNQSL